MTTDESFDPIADLPDNGARQKEVYARYGLAMYYAQVFETGLVTLLAIATTHQSKVPITRPEADAMFDELFGYTSGRLLKRLAGIMEVGGEGADDWQNAVRERNRLAHHYFRDHAENFVTTEGMQRMVDDADGVRELFERADLVTTAITRALLADVGVTDAQIEEQYDMLIERARARESQRSM